MGMEEVREKVRGEHLGKTLEELLSKKLKLATMTSAFNSFRSPCGQHNHTSHKEGKQTPQQDS